MASPISESVPVLIAGAGITGLLVAHGLKKRNIPYVLFESEKSASTYRPREWAMAIHWSMPHLKNLLPDDRFADLLTASVDPSRDTRASGGYSVPFYNAQTGERFREFPAVNGIRASRRKLRAYCTEGIKVEYDKNVTGVKFAEEDGKKVVVVSFEDGTSRTGSTLVAADGAKSRIRNLIFGEEAGSGKPIEGLVCFSTLPNFPNNPEIAKSIRDLHFMNHVGLDPENGVCVWTSILDVPDADKPETWKFQFMTTGINSLPSGIDNPARLAELKTRASKLVEPWKSAFAAMPEDTQVYDDKLLSWVTAPWDSHEGRVVFAGDAAHAMPPHRGQGLNQSVCDADKYVEAIASANSGEKSLEEAISAYQTELVARGSEEVVTSTRSAIFIHDFEKFSQAPVMQKGYSKGGEAEATKS